MQINNATGIKRPDQHCEVTAGEKERLWYSTVKEKNAYFTGKMQCKILQHKKVLPKRALSSTLPMLKEFKSHQHKTY